MTTGVRHRRAWSRRLLSRAMGMGLFASSTAGAASPSDARAAQELFEEARALMAQQRYPEACPKLAESQRLDPGGGTALNLAVCHAAEGKLATALTDYERALAASRRDGRKDREAIATEAIARLVRDVPRVTFQVELQTEIAALTLSVDEVAVPSESWDRPLPIDPGEHRVRATGPGKEPWSATFTIAPRETRSIDVPVLQPARSPLPGGDLGARSREAPMVRVDTPEHTPIAAPTSRTKASPLYAVVVTGTVLALTTAGVTGLWAYVSREQAKIGCSIERGYCVDPGSASALEQSTSLAWVSTVALGGAALGALGILVLPSRVAVAPSPTTGGAAITLRTAF